jgi:hypothetical protein
MDESELPKRGEPTGGWKKYADCIAGMSITIRCGRPDCARCDTIARAAHIHHYEKFLALVQYLSKGKTLPPKAKDLIDHFDPSKNACMSDINMHRVSTYCSHFADDSSYAKRIEIEDAIKINTPEMKYLVGKELDMMEKEKTIGLDPEQSFLENFYDVWQRNKNKVGKENKVNSWVAFAIGLTTAAPTGAFSCAKRPIGFMDISTVGEF